METKNALEGVTKDHFRICAKENPGKEIGFQKTTKNDVVKKAKQKKKRRREFR